ncbi:MAG: transglycosylase SLT domain-containing protein [Dehalococcoidia bacterium]|nr:transglycosylase SLT domain-containing protein [Dehalococcoidia bacterium]
MRWGYQPDQRLFALAAGLVLVASLGFFGSAQPEPAPLEGLPGTVSIGRFGAAPLGASTESAGVELPFRAFHAAGIETLTEELVPRLSYGTAVQARDRGDVPGAIAAFRLAAESGHPLASISRLRLAQLLVSTGDPTGAAPYFAFAAEDPVLPASLRAVALDEGVAAMVAAGDPAGALAVLDRRAQDASASGSQRAGAIWRSALIRRDLGDAGWVNAAHTAISTAPQSAAAREALDILEAGGHNHEALETAYVRYRANEGGRAREIYEQIVDGRVQPSPGAPGLATAWFYLGALAEDRDELQQALDAYGRSLDMDPGGHLAHKAVYWRGRVAEGLGQRDLAIASYDWLASQYPSSPFAAEGEQRAALAVAESGNVDAALDRLEGLVSRHNGEKAAEAARWHSLLRGEHGRMERPALDAVKYAPGSFAAVLAGSAVVTDPLPEAALAEAPAGGVDPDAAQQWLDATFGAEEAPGLMDGRTFRMFSLMEAFGQDDAVRTWLSVMVAGAEGRPHDLYAVASELARRGMWDSSMHAAQLLLTPLTPEQRLSAPPAVHRLAYPAPFTEELTQAANEQGVPPLLLLALVRQESAFNPTAGSHVGARGLTQVMGPTGQQIAASLNVRWDISVLNDPATALRFGAHYLAEQIRYFDGNVLAALAAYNAGPGSAQRWLKEQRLPGAEGYIATINYAETRLYVERVLENYAWYRYAYAGAPAPSIR